MDSGETASSYGQASDGADDLECDAGKTVRTFKAEETNPLKERIVLDEFSAKTSNNDLSSKVDKKDAPVASNVKE